MKHDTSYKFHLDNLFSAKAVLDIYYFEEIHLNVFSDCIKIAMFFFKS
jgi:hypothetical protein